MFYSPHPLLRKRETETATVSYSELLFDLIYVFSVTQLSHYLLHNLTWERNNPVVCSLDVVATYHLGD